MQIDLMICISRSFLSLMSSDILGQELFLWETGLISRTKIINNDTTFQRMEVHVSFPPSRVHTWRRKDALVCRLRGLAVMRLVRRVPARSVPGTGRAEAVPFPRCGNLRVRGTLLLNLNEKTALELRSPATELLPRRHARSSWCCNAAEAHAGLRHRNMASNREAIGETEEAPAEGAALEAGTGTGPREEVADPPIRLSQDTLLPREADGSAPLCSRRQP